MPRVTPLRYAQNDRRAIVNLPEVAKSFGAIVNLCEVAEFFGAIVILREVAEFLGQLSICAKSRNLWKLERTV